MVDRRTGTTRHIWANGSVDSRRAFWGVALTQCDLERAQRLFEELAGGQAIAAEVTDYSKKAFEDSTRAFEQLIGAKSIEQAIEIQSQYAKKAYDTYVAEMSKLGEMYVGLAKDAYKPVEAAFTKKVA